MPHSETTARKKWCPFVRVEGSNRMHNTISDGFQNTSPVYHCIASQCMAWRELHLSHMKGMQHAPEAAHGYCGLAGRPDLEQGW